MFKRITESENMNTPSNNIIVLDRIHIFPGKFQMFSKSKTMNMNLCTSSKDISLCAKLSSSSWCEYFNGYSIDIIYFTVCKINYNLLETVILSASQSDRFVVWAISNESYVSSSEFEEFRRRSLVAFEELPFSLRVLSDVEYSAQHFSVGIFTLNGIKRLFENNFLTLLMLLMQEDLSELSSLP